MLVHVYYDTTTLDWRWSMRGHGHGHGHGWMDLCAAYIHTTQSQRGQSKVAPIVSLQSNKEIKASGEKGEPRRKKVQTNLAAVVALANKAQKRGS